MFELKSSCRGGALGYASLIQSFFNKAGITVSGIPFISLSTDQELTRKTLSMMGHMWDPKEQKYRYFRRSNSVRNSDDDQEYGSKDDQDAADHAPQADMEEDNHASPQTTTSVISMLEDMRLQHQEDVSLINERISTLSNQVRVQSEQFGLYTATQDQRYNTLCDMMSAQSAKFDAFSSTFLAQFPPGPSPDDQAPDN